jgi:hypothetical protein
LPVPSTKEILNRRVTFIKDKIQEEIDHRGSYFLKKGIRLTINKIKAFSVCLEEIFINTEYVARLIGWLSNYDIRRSLQISQRIITSPIISIDNLITTYLSDNSLNVTAKKIKQALIFGDYNLFCQENSNYILNIFLIRGDEITSPIAKLSILRLLIDKESHASENENAYILVDDIQNFFEPTGLPRNTTNRLLENLLQYRLLETYDPTDNAIYEQQRVRITPSGKIHYEISLNDDIYVSHMALTTPIRNYDLVYEIREVRKHKMEGKDWYIIISKFISYCLEQDKQFINIPELPSYHGQKFLRTDLKRKWVPVSEVKWSQASKLT